MIETNAILEFAEDLIHQKTETYFSELQRCILTDALQKERKTYDQIAEDCGYSSRYVKQDVAPKLWLLISQSVGEKVNKSNVRAALEAAMRNQGAKSPTYAELPYTELIQTEPSYTESPYTELIQTESLYEPTDSLNPTKADILLVDDQPQNLKLLSDLLEEQGYEVQQAINGAIALQAIQASPPDLVFLDIHMPQMDGYTLCQYIKADLKTSSIPVIFISAINEPWDKVKAFSAGGCDYITKPFKVVEVLARLENHLKIQQLQKTLSAQNIKLQRAIQELQRLAAIDDVTKVARRHRFDAYLLDCWQQAQRKHSSITLLLIQVDNFSAYGAANRSRIIDQALHAIAQLIQQSVEGEQDLVARYGAITFAVLLPEQTKVEASAMAQKILQHISKAALLPDSLEIAADSVKPKVSIGIAGINFSDQKLPYSGIGEFLEASERTLQKAKQRGDCFVDT